MVTHAQNLGSAINPSKVHTHSSEHTHPEQWAAIYAAALALLKGTSVVALKVERELYIHSPPPTIPACPRLELATFGLRVRLSNH